MTSCYYYLSFVLYALKKADNPTNNAIMGDPNPMISPNPSYFLKVPTANAINI